MVVVIVKRRIGDVELYVFKFGVIGNKNIELGVNVLLSVVVFDLLDINIVYVNIFVLENEFGKFKKG